MNHKQLDIPWWTPSLWTLCCLESTACVTSDNATLSLYIENVINNCTNDNINFKNLRFIYNIGTFVTLITLRSAATCTARRHCCHLYYYVTGIKVEHQSDDVRVPQPLVHVQFVTAAAARQSRVWRPRRVSSRRRPRRRTTRPGKPCRTCRRPTRWRTWFGTRRPRPRLLRRSFQLPSSQWRRRTTGTSSAYRQLCRGTIYYTNTRASTRWNRSYFLKWKSASWNVSNSVKMPFFYTIYGTFFEFFAWNGYIINFMKYFILWFAKWNENKIIHENFVFLFSEVIQFILV